MSINEREANELVRPLEALPEIEARSADRRRRRRRHPVRLALAVGVIGVLGTGSAFAAIETLSGESRAQEQQRLSAGTEASDQEVLSEVEEHSGGSIAPSEVDPDGIRAARQRELAVSFPDELRFVDKDNKVVHVTVCNWPNPNPDCQEPFGAIENYPGAKYVETWSDGEPIAGGS